MNVSGFNYESLTQIYQKKTPYSFGVESSGQMKYPIIEKYNIQMKMNPLQA